MKDQHILDKGYFYICIYLIIFHLLINFCLFIYLLCYLFIYFILFYFLFHPENLVLLQRPQGVITPNQIPLTTIVTCLQKGAGRSSEVERSLMVRWVVGSILHGVDPLSYFSFQPVLHDWCNKDRGMCYPVRGMVHIKKTLLLIDKSSLCGGSGFPF